MAEPFSVVFSGGGCRAFWCLGVWHGLVERVPEPGEIAGVSAGFVARGD